MSVHRIAALTARAAPRHVCSTLSLARRHVVLCTPTRANVACRTTVRLLHASAARHSSNDGGSPYTEAEFAAIQEEWKAAYGDGPRSQLLGSTFTQVVAMCERKEQERILQGKSGQAPESDISRFDDYLEWIQRKIAQRKLDVEEAWTKDKYDQEKGLRAFATQEEARVELVEHRLRLYESMTEDLLDDLSERLFDFKVIRQLARQTGVDVAAPPEPDPDDELDDPDSFVTAYKARQRSMRRREEDMSLDPRFYISLDPDDVEQVLCAKPGAFYSPTPMLSIDGQRFRAHFEHQVRFYMRPKARLDELYEKLTTTQCLQHDALEREVDRVNRNLCGPDEPSMFTPPPPPALSYYDDRLARAAKVKQTPLERRTFTKDDVPRIEELERLVLRYPQNDARHFALRVARFRVLQKVAEALRQARGGGSLFGRLRGLFG